MRIADTVPWSIGADIGFSNTRVAKVANGAPIKVLRFPTDVKGGPGGVLEQISAGVRELRANEPTPPAGLGVGIAGQCDVRTGMVRCGPNLWWKDEPLERELSEATGLRTVLRNDVVMATVGEWRHGAGQGARNVAAMFFGTGIGGGAVVEGRLLEGATGCGGHFGHISVDLDGPTCACGRKGCVEAFAGGWAVARRAQEAMRGEPAISGPLRSLSAGRPETVDCRMVAEAAHRGDRFALAIRDDMAAAISSAVATVINVLNPERFMLGGTVLNGFPELYDMVVEGALRSCLGPAREGLTIVPASLGDLSGAVGAATMVL